MEETHEKLVDSIRNNFNSDYQKLLHAIRGLLKRDYQEVLIDLKDDLVKLKDLKHKYIEDVNNKSFGEGEKLTPDNTYYVQAKAQFARDVDYISKNLLLHIEQLEKDKGVIEGMVRDIAHKIREIIIDNSYVDKQAAELLILLHRIRESVYSLDSPDSEVNKAIGLVNNEYDFTRSEKKAIDKAEEILDKLEREL